MGTIYAELGLSSVTATMAHARATILDANANVDDLFKHATAYHCDAENFNRCNFVITSNLSATVQQIREDRLDAARENFGTALHTLQDFYAHSNWIELGHNELHPLLGKPGTIGDISPSIYNGSTSDEPSCRELTLGLSCSRNNLITSLLTSGYYSGQDRSRPAGKCRHGGLLDLSPGIGGIAKDMSVCTGFFTPDIFDSPHSDNHPAAAALAVRYQVRLVGPAGPQAAPARVVRLPVARRLARSAVDHQIVRPLGDVGIEIVHQHSQRGFLRPAFAGQRGAARRSDGAGCSGHEGLRSER